MEHPCLLLTGQGNLRLICQRAEYTHMLNIKIHIKRKEPTETISGDFKLKKILSPIFIQKYFSVG